MSETRAVLERLLRRVGRDAARCEAMSDSAAHAMSRERAFGEANVLRIVQAYIREELKKVKP